MKTKVNRFFLSLPLLFLVFGNGACEVQVGGIPGQSGEAAVSARLSSPEEKTLREEISKNRKDKDEEFRKDPESPIAEEYRREFQGLAYYPVDFGYRFQGRIHRLPEGKNFKMSASDGELRNAVHWGYFRFRLNETTICTLQVYKMNEKKDSSKAFLFIPFRDKNAGKETYGGGRYLDVEENREGIYVLDFNQVYNPYCAYGKSYSCPIPPLENSLSVAIPVGEKSFPIGGKH